MAESFQAVAWYAKVNPEESAWVVSRLGPRGPTGLPQMSTSRELGLPGAATPWPTVAQAARAELAKHTAHVAVVSPHYYDPRDVQRAVAALENALRAVAEEALGGLSLIDQEGRDLDQWDGMPVRHCKLHVDWHPHNGIPTEGSFAVLEVPDEHLTLRLPSFLRFVGAPDCPLVAAGYVCHPQSIHWAWGLVRILGGG